MIRLENISKHYVRGGEVVKALDDISLHIHKGTLALVHGPSGSGKSTLIHLMAGLMLPTSGRLLVAEQNIEQLPPARRAGLRAHRIAVVFQMFHLLPYLTALENVLLPTLARRNPEAIERAYELVVRLGLTHRAGHRPAELSVGERQRVATARAMLNHPEIILADEPTGNLDEESAGLVLDLLEHARTEGATVLLVSHQHLHRIHPDLTFELREGRLVTRGNP
ncbi:MAG TPA: ABC transporter ATP-binding protein [Candidatus Hydrogenedentes bacterium]|nr:ABC transporter ATP-binding protein [Candidatus Hydrogenedentota bacterium]